jgi:RNA polymerase sigma factor (sigma-70 family)
MDSQTTPTFEAAPPTGTRPDDARADALLAVRCQLGERAAFDDLIHRFAMPLRRYVIRRVMDHRRARYAAPAGTEAELDALAADGPEPDAGLEAREVERGLERLPPIEREVLSLFYLDDLSLAEVSQVLAIPVGTVKSRLHRARTLLRNHVTGESHD